MATGDKLVVPTEEDRRQVEELMGAIGGRERGSLFGIADLVERYKALADRFERLLDRLEAQGIDIHIQMGAGK